MLAQPPTDAELYTAACAACHGDDGRGRAQEDVGFATPLPDFTDCSFASREPDPDWYAVVHEGGPVRAFDRMMPAFGKALGQPEIDAVLRHVRTFCVNASWPRGEFNLPRPLFTEKAFPEDEIVVTASFGADRDHGASEVELLYEKRIGPRGMVEIALPLTYGKEEQTVDPSPGAAAGTGREIGLGNVALGYKHAVSHDLERGSIWSVGAEAILARGNGADSWSSRLAIFEPFAAYAKLLPGDAFLQFQVLAEVAAQAGAEDAAELRAVWGRTWTEGGFGRVWTPMIEVLASRDLGSDALTRVDMVPQVQVSLSKRQHVLLNLGVRLPLDDEDDRGTRTLVYLLWDWFDGGFFDGW